MVLTFENVFTFLHPWNIVTSAHWRKYPNSFSRHVVEIDTLERKINPDGTLIVKKILKMQTSIPGWLSLIGVPTAAYAIETVEVNLKEKRMSISNMNLTGRKYLEVTENIQFYPNPQSPFTQTDYKHHTRLLSNFTLFSNQLENYYYNKLKQKAHNSPKAIDFICNNSLIDNNSDNTTNDTNTNNKIKFKLNEMKEPAVNENINIDRERQKQKDHNNNNNNNNNHINNIDRSFSSRYDPSPSLHVENR